MENVDRSSYSGQTSDQQLDLHGSTLQVYWYILTQRKAAFFYQDIQKVMGFSSKSSAIYQLEKLCELEVLQKTGNGYVIVSRPKPRALQSYFFINFILIPKAFIYGVMLSIINFSVFLLSLNGLDFLTILLASIPNMGAIMLFFSEAILVWKNRPKPPHTKSILQSLSMNFKKRNNSSRSAKKNQVKKSSMTKTTTFTRFLSQRIPISRTTKRFLLAMVIILFLTGQIVLIGTLTGFFEGRFTARITTNTQIEFPDPLPIQLRPTGYDIQGSSLYALGHFTNGTTGRFLFHFEFNSDLTTLEAFYSYKFPSHLPIMGIGLAFYNASYWALAEVENQTMPQPLYCFTKDMSSIQNYSLGVPPIVHNMNLRFSRRDIVIWNGSLWILEWWLKPGDDRFRSNVSIYSMKNFARVKTFFVPIKAEEFSFDSQGQLWLCEFDHYPETYAAFMAIAPDDGTILRSIRPLTFPSFFPLNHDRDSFFSYYPILFNDSFLVPIADDLITELWGFQIISYELDPSSRITDFLGLLLITVGLEGGGLTFLWYVSSKRKRLK
ncbi:MAG: hypothetical protein ACFFFG_18065 [Candidatus Thorarchaeota archaeon]